MIRKYKEIWIPFVCFLFIMCLLLLEYILPLDLWFYDQIKPMIKEPFISILKVFTFLGEPKTVVVLAFLWGAYLWKNNPKEMRPFLLLLLLSLSAIVLLKLIFVRERPDILRLIPIDGYSFPSGHSIISVSFYGYLATYFLEQRKKKKLWLALPFFVLILGIGFSRIYLGVHYFSDVLAGYSVGACILGIVNLIRRKDNMV